MTKTAKNTAARIGMENISSMSIPGYHIESEIGHGGMATVYLAVQESLQRRVALKVMAPALSADRTFGERFMKEARTVAQLSHPHILSTEAPQGAKRSASGWQYALLGAMAAIIIGGCIYLLVGKGNQPIFMSGGSSALVDTGSSRAGSREGGFGFAQKKSALKTMILLEKSAKGLGACLAKLPARRKSAACFLWQNRILRPAVLQRRLGKMLRSATGVYWTWTVRTRKPGKD